MISFDTLYIYYLRKRDAGIFFKPNPPRGEEKRLKNRFFKTPVPHSTVKDPIKN